MAGSQAGRPEEKRVVLTARNLSKSFGGFMAVKNVNIDVHDAEVHALIGPNGAGKTTVFNLLTKFHRPSGGRIELEGRDITGLAPDRVARLGLVRSFQISAVFPHFSVLDNVRLALQRPNGLAVQFWRSNAILDRLDGRAEELVAMVGLKAERDMLAADLSYGRKRALEIATTLALDPKVLLLDEPMAGMGTEDIATIAGLIREVARERAVVMVEHNLKVVADLCQRVTVLQRGEILAEGDYAAVSRNPAVRTAYMGTEEAA